MFKSVPCAESLDDLPTAVVALRDAYRAAKVPFPRKKGGQTAFRLTDEEIALLDAIAEHLTKERGVTHSRTDAVRASARAIAEVLQIVTVKKKK